MKVLVACEFSGTVRNAFLARGHDAWSCDLLPTENPGPHITGDVLQVLREGWDLMICHPPCTYLTCSAEWAYGPGPYHQRLKPGTLTGAARQAARDEAIRFAFALWEAPIGKVVLENPVGVLSRPENLGKPTQIIQPHQFGHDAAKATCLWMRGDIRPLTPTGHFPPRIVIGKDGKEYKRWGNQTDSGQNRLTPSESRQKDRSKTYAGIAEAMASQWG